MTLQNIAIFGSTGSVGQSTLDVIARHPDRFSVTALSASTSVDKMAEQCAVFSPKFAIMADKESALRLTDKLVDLGLAQIEVKCGQTALTELAKSAEIDTLMAAIVGAAGLLPTLAAVRTGKRVLIANKEPLVMTGDLFMREAEKSGALILPIDSEHNAIFQCLPDDQSKLGVRRIHLTASGGPFRGRKWSELADITPAQACAHPNWSMGNKISVDSATMMNKGLELIEASALFGISATDVEVIIHPQSIIHSLVEYEDGSFLAQLGAPDMRIPITHALSWPQRIESGAVSLNLAEIARLDFEQPDMANLPCLRLAREAASEGGAAPAVLNAANEVAVGAFLQSRLGFTKIPELIESVINSTNFSAPQSIDDVLQIDNEVRQYASARLNSLAL